MVPPPRVMTVRSRLQSALLMSARGADRVAAGLRHLAAGTMHLADVRRGIEREYSAFNTSDADIDAGLLPWEADLVARFVHVNDRVLVVGSGAGRDLLPLAAMGCRVTGVEPAERSLVRARAALERRGVAAALVNGYFEDVALDGPFDVISFSNYCYSTIPARARRIDALRKAARLLAPGGCAVVSFLSSAATPRTRLVTAARWVGALSRSDWRLEEGDVLSVLPAPHALVGYAHVFAPDEAEAEAAAAGLRVAFRRPPALVLQHEPDGLHGSIASP
jgi:SAM-dependent methyltransferase